MDEDTLAFLDAPTETPATDTAVQQPIVETPAATETPVAGATPAADKETQPAATAVTDPAKQEHNVPLATFLDMRDKLKKVEARNAELEPKDTDPVVPDPAKDPAGYAHFLTVQTQMTTMNDRLNFSEKLARKEHGTEMVDKVREWALAKFDTDDDFTRRVLGDADPYEAAIAIYNEEQLRSELKNPEDIAAFRAWKAAQANGGTPVVNAEVKPAATAATPATKAVAKPVVIPKSLVTAPQGGGGTHAIPVGDGNAFDATFNR